MVIHINGYIIVLYDLIFNIIVYESKFSKFLLVSLIIIFLFWTIYRNESRSTSYHFLQEADCVFC